MRTPASLSAVVIAHNQARWLPGTLGALDRELAEHPDARKLVLDAASSDASGEIARSLGWRVLRLSAAGATCAGAAREAARCSVASCYLLMVDGDVEVEPGFLTAALQILAQEPGCAGVGGALRFDEGSGVPPHQGPAREARAVLAALSVYRSADLQAVGGFVPFLESEEDADLGLRLRGRGGQLVVIRPGGVHRSGPRGGWAESWRRFRAGMYLGQGRVLRLRAGSPLFGATLARQWLYLAVPCLWGGAALAAVLHLAGGWLWAWPVAAWLALVVRGKRPAAALVSLGTWQLMAVGLLLGWLLPPAHRSYVLEQEER